MGYEENHYLKPKKKCKVEGYKKSVGIAALAYDFVGFD